MNEEEKWGSTVGDYRKASKFPNEIAELEKENPESTKAMVKASKYIAAYIDSLNLSYIPELRFTDFLECSGWEEKALSEVAEIKRGNGLSKSSVAEGGKNPCILYGELFTKYNTVIKSILSYTNESAPVKSKAGDILMPTSDVTPKGLAKASMISIDDVTLGGDMNIIRPNQKLVDSIFLAYAINYFSKKIIDKVSGSSVKHIYASDLKDISYEFPSLPEQQKIAEFFSALDERIALNADKVKLLKEQKAGYLQRVFSQEMVFTDDNGDRFADWDNKKFTEVLEPIATKKYQIFTKDMKLTGKFEVVDQGKSEIAGYSDEDDKVFSNVPAIVYGDHTTTVKFRKNKFIVGADGTKVLIAKGFNSPEFLFHALCHYNVEPEGYKRHYSIVKDISLPIPSLPEQEKIAEFFSALDEQIELIENKLELLKEQKKGYLQGIFG